MMSKKRIAFLINTLIIGGAERTVSNLSQHLYEKYDIDIIVNDDQRLDFPYRGNLISLGLRAEGERMGMIYQIRALFRRIRMLKKLKRERDYAAVLSFSEMTNLANVFCRERKPGHGSKVIISVHNSIRKSSENSWKHKLFSKTVLPYCLKGADRVVSCSREIGDELMTRCGLPAEKSCVIYNGIDPKEIAIRSQESSADSEKVREPDGHLIVSIGRLTYQKGHWHLIRAVRKLKDDGMKIKLIILGEGELRESYEKMIHAMGLDQTVFLPGFLKNPCPYIVKADAVVFSSLYEGFSNAIVEALACGAPCISTDHTTGAREIFAPESDFRKKITDHIEYARFGVLVPVCDGRLRGPETALSDEENLMAEAIRKVINDPDLSARYRKSGLQRAAELDVESISRQWAGLIEEVG